MNANKPELRCETCGLPERDHFLHTGLPETHPFTPASPTGGE